MMSPAELMQLWLSLPLWSQALTIAMVVLPLVQRYLRALRLQRLRGKYPHMIKLEVQAKPGGRSKWTVQNGWKKLKKVNTHYLIPLGHWLVSTANNLILQPTILVFMSTWSFLVYTVKTTNHAAISSWQFIQAQRVKLSALLFAPKNPMPPSVLRKPKAERLEQAAKTKQPMKTNYVQFDIHSTGDVRTQQFYFNPHAEPGDRVPAEPSRTPPREITKQKLIDDPEEIGRRLSERSKIKQRIQTPPPKRRQNKQPRLPLPTAVAGKENAQTNMAKVPRQPNWNSTTSQPSKSFQSPLPVRGTDQKPARPFLYSSQGALSEQVRKRRMAGETLFSHTPQETSKTLDVASAQKQPKRRRLLTSIPTNNNKRRIHFTLQPKREREEEILKEFNRKRVKETAPTVATPTAPATTAGATPAAASTPGFAFGAATPAAATTPAAAPTGEGFKFGATPAPAAAADATKAGAATTPAFQFGAAAAPAPTPGATPAPVAPTPSFGGTPAATATPVAPGQPPAAAAPATDASKPPKVQFGQTPAAAPSAVPPAAGAPAFQFGQTPAAAPSTTQPAAATTPAAPTISFCGSKDPTASANATPGFNFGNAAATPAIATPATATGGGFNFGNAAATPAGTPAPPAPGAFGATTPAPSATGFGGFGSTSAAKPDPPAAKAFGSTASNTPQPANPAPAFGSTPNPPAGGSFQSPAFGQNNNAATTPAAPAFGQNNSTAGSTPGFKFGGGGGATGFGQPAPTPGGTPGFGQPGFGQQPAPAPGGATGFGQPAPGGATGFGQPAAGGTPGFGQPTPGGTPGFGQPQPPQFGAAGSGFQSTPSAGGFATPSAGGAPGFTVGGTGASARRRDRNRKGKRR